MPVKTTEMVNLWLYLQIDSLYAVPQKNDTNVAHYNFNPHQPILVIFFGRNVAEKPY